MNCFRLLLYIFNFIFILVGIVLISIGTWTAVTKVYVSFVIGDALFGAASYLLIGVGVVIIVVCIVGISALWKKKRKWLIVYLCLLILSFLILVTAAVLAVVFKGVVESVMVTTMRESMINGYGKDRDITNSWDQLQSELQCCAISETVLVDSHIFDYPYVDGTNPQNMEERGKQDSWAIYKRTEFYRLQMNVGVNERKYVPPSCCVYDKRLGDYKDLKHCQYFPHGPPSNYANSLQNDYLFYSGCYQKAKQVVLDQSDIIVALGFVFAFIMISGMVLTFFVMRSASDDEDIKHRQRSSNVERD